MIFKKRRHHKRLPREHRGSLSTVSPGYIFLALLMAGLYTALSMVTPLTLDDWTFMGNWRDDAGNTVFSFSGWWRYYDFIRSYDNGRIANALSPFSTMISPWKEFFPFLTGCMTAGTALQLQRFATRRSSTLFLAIVWAFMIVCLPWKDTLFVRDYALNYSWSAAITLCLLWLLLLGERDEWTSGRLFGAIILAFIAGGWHEGFAVPTLCGLFLLVLARRGRLSLQFYSVSVVYLCSTLLFMLSPGMIGRIGNEFSTASHGVLYRQYALPALTLGLIFILLFTRSGRDLLKRTFNRNIIIVCCGIIIAGYFIAYTTVNTPRSYFWPSAACIIITVYLLSHLPFLGKKPLRTVITLLIGAACTFQTVVVIIWQRRYTREANEITALLGKSETGTVFYDSILPETTPSYTLGIPVSNSWRNIYHYGALSSYFITPVIGVVPTELKEAEIGKAEPLGGSDSLYLYHGHIVGPLPADFRTGNRLVPQHRKPGIGNGETIMLAIPFVTEKSDTLIYYRDLN